MPSSGLPAAANRRSSPSFAASCLRIPEKSASTAVRKQGMPKRSATCSRGITCLNGEPSWPTPRSAWKSAKKNDEAHQKRLKEMMADYGLAHFMNARPSELSGGMRQRAALIRTLALEPDILLLDEPFSALDYQTRLSVCDDISAIIRKQHKTAVLITHDLSEAVSVADRIMILSDRPARIKAILKTPFPDPDMTPLKRRNDPAFSSCFNEVWTILQNKSTEVSHGIT